MSEKEYGTEITLIWADGYTRNFPIENGLRGIRHGQARPIDAIWTTVEPKWEQNYKEWFISHLHTCFARGVDTDEIVTKLFGEGPYEM